MFRILVVCMGNICRSPIAESVFHALVRERGLTASVEIDSAGTYAGHQGSKPDSRAIAVATARGYEQITRQRARRVLPRDFELFDLVLAMDQANMRHLKEMCPPQHQHKIQLFLDYAGLGAQSEVPDPYYGNLTGFARVMELCESGASAVMDRVAPAGFQTR